MIKQDHFENKTFYFFNTAYVVPSFKCRYASMADMIVKGGKIIKNRNGTSKSISKKRLAEKILNYSGSVLAVKK